MVAVVGLAGEEIDTSDQRDTRSGVFWERLLRVCSDVADSGAAAVPGLYRHGLLAVILRTEIGLTVEETARLIGRNKGHTSRVIHQANECLRRLLSDDQSGLCAALDRAAELRAAAPQFDPLTAAEWRRLEPLMPAQKQHGGRFCDHRTTVNGILWKLQTGRGWRQIPPTFGSWSTANKRYYAWQRLGLWPRIQSRLESRFAAQYEGVE